MNRTQAHLAISLGWNPRGPMSIHRRAPLTSRPMPGTKTSISRPIARSSDPLLTHRLVTQAGGIILARAKAAKAIRPRSVVRLASSSQKVAERGTTMPADCTATTPSASMAATTIRSTSRGRMPRRYRPWRGLGISGGDDPSGVAGHIMRSSMVLPTVNGTSTGPAIYLETFGCQMNELDSELVKGHLQALGYHFIDDRSVADIVLFNTCSVREQAENKVFSRVGQLRQEKQDGRNVVVGLLGCLAEREGAGLIKRIPEVDLLCGPGELDRLPLLLDNVLKGQVVEEMDRVALQGSNARRSAALSAAADSLEMLDLSRAFDPDGGQVGGRAAYVRITRGCNKFCTYCVVPNTRGAEVHRSPDAIIDECRALADQGVVEVTLLGQTVNHYVYVHGAAVAAGGREVPQIGPGLSAFRSDDRGGGGRRCTSFADLLGRIHEEVPTIERLRFVTSYPRDFGDDILQVMQASRRICRYLHVPAQSGSDRILKLMNRGYTVGHYLDFIDRVVDALPDVSIAGDIIVGFPTESDEDFEATCDLVRTVPFKNNFVFKYSPRPGTVAIDRFEDDVPEQVKRDRLNHLLDIQSDVSRAVHQREVGRVHQVFIEKQGTGGPGGPGGAASTGFMMGGGQVHLGWVQEPSPMIQMSGRTPGDLITVFDVPATGSPEALIGQIVAVQIESAAPAIAAWKAANGAFGVMSGYSTLRMIALEESFELCGLSWIQSAWRP